MTNLASLLEESAQANPDRTAIVLGPQRLTYAQVDTLASQVADLLVARGIRPGDAVALSCPNLPAFTYLYFGILKAGAVVVPLNVLLKGREVAYHLDDGDVKAYFAFEGTDALPIGAEAHMGFTAAERCEYFFVITADPRASSPIEGTESLGQALADRPGRFDALAVDDDETAVILYTSGTTGQPKGAELRHRNLRDNALVSRQLFDIDSAQPDTYLAVLPLFHTFGQTVIQNGAVAHGGTVVLMPRFDPAGAIEAMAREQVTVFGGVPTMYWGMLGALGDVPDAAEKVATIAASLRIAVAGGAALPVEVHREFERRFGVTILEGYGLSETSPTVSFSEYGAPARPGSIGVPIPGVEMKLIQPGSWDEIADPEGIGEIAIRGHNVMKGYYKRPEATAEAINAEGWFRSGDLARRDADGWYYIVDRAKEMIIRGGYNVYPREVEEVLLTHPAVSLAAVIGIPHDSHGEEVKAFVILKPGATTTSAELVGWSRDTIAAYKYPREIKIVESLPTTATGKILKRELR